MGKVKKYLLLKFLEGRQIQLEEWTVPAILKMVNANRMDGWSKYNEETWKTGLFEFTEYYILGEVDKDIVKLEDYVHMGVFRTLFDLTMQEEKDKPSPLSMSEVLDTKITGRMIKNIRVKLGLSQYKFARYIGANDSSVSNWERKGVCVIRKISVRAKIVRASKMSREELLRQLAGESIPTRPRVKLSKTQIASEEVPIGIMIVNLIGRYKKGLSLDAIFHLTGLTKKQVGNALHGKKRSGVIKMSEDGVYTLA